MGEEQNNRIPGAGDLDRLMAERDRQDLEQAIDQALAVCPPDQFGRLRERLRQSAELRRFEHGGSFVSVKVGDQWLPLDRAVTVLVERGSG